MAGSSPPDLFQSSRLKSFTLSFMTSAPLQANNHALLLQITFKIGDGDGAAVKDTGCQRTIDARLHKGVAKMLRRACAAGSNQRDMTDRAHFAQLLQIVTVAH